MCAKLSPVPGRLSFSRGSGHVVGHLFYGSAREPIFLSDLPLAYLQVVAVAKLRRRETFLASWCHPRDTAGDHSSLWFHPSIPLMFVIGAAREIRLDPAILDRLMVDAASPTGLTLDRVNPIATPTVAPFVTASSGSR